MRPNRVVALLTPLFASLGGLVSKLLAEYAPGVNIPEEDLNAIFIGGALIALAPAIQWLNGWQKHEARESEILKEVQVAAARATPAAPETAGDYGAAAGYEYGDEVYEYGDEDGYEYDEEYDDDLVFRLDKLVRTGG